MLRSRRSSKSPYHRDSSRHCTRKLGKRWGRLEWLESRNLLTGYMQANLVSDQAGAALIQDPKLIAPWGIAEASNGNFWVADSGSSVSTVYSDNGQTVAKNPLVVDLPGGLPTGVVFNSNGGFDVTGADGSTGSAKFIFDSLNGNQAGWNPSVPNLGTTSTLAQLAAQVDGAVYTGLAMGTVNGTTYLYAADFQNGTIDVFDTNFDLVTSLPGNFVDPNLPANYSPFDVQVVNGQLYVTYAQYKTNGPSGGDNDQDDNGQNDQAARNEAHGNGNGNGNGNGDNGNGDNGHGHHGHKGAGDNDNDDAENGGAGPSGVRLLVPTGGIVDVYDLSGNFVQRLSADSSLNAPWGMALAPGGFGQFAGDLLVGNFGDGRITALNPSTGVVGGQLTNPDGTTISINHLLGLAFGNQPATANTLFFTSAPSGNATTTASANPSLIVLDTSGDGALSAVGNGNVAVSSGGTIAVDSDSSSAVTASGNAQIAAGTIDVVGSAATNGNANIDGTLDTGAAAVADPLAALAGPSTAGLQTFSAVHIADHGHVTLQPGVYTGGIDVSGQASLLLMPGIYILQGGGLRISGSATVVGQAVTIFNSPQNANDSISVTGQGSLTLTGPATGAYKGIAIFQSRGAGSPLVVDGQGSINVQGILYTPNATAEVSGNGRLIVLNDVDDSIPAQLIVFDLNVVGNGTVNVSGSGINGPIGGVHGLLGSLQAAGTTPLTALGGSFSATEDTSFTGPVAAFDAAASGAVAANFTATIDWGDGTTSAGTVTATGNGGFLVLGNHTYTEEGTEKVTVTAGDNHGNTATSTAQVQVADAPLVAAGIDVPIQQSLTLSNLQIASVTDTGGAEAAGSYTAAIDWGDGSASSAGTVDVSGNTVNVVGSHTYAMAGRYHVNITVQDEGGASTVVHSIVIVGSPPPTNLFVGSAFDDVLQRPIDQQALQNFVNALQSGEPRGIFALTLTHSDEYLESQIEQAYQHFLGRDADNAGMIFWLNMMKGGLTIEQLESQFIGSPEYYQHSGDTDLLWVDHMYFDLLGRAPDTAGQTFWINALAGGDARALVALGFANSSEHESIIVRDDYQTYLSRQPAPAEVNYWVSQFEQGVNNENVVAGFIASDEYFNTHGKD